MFYQSIIIPANIDVNNFRIANCKCERLVVGEIGPEGIIAFEILSYLVTYRNPGLRMSVLVCSDK